MFIFCYKSLSLKNKFKKIKMVCKVKKTLKNLDRVLGIRSKTLKIRKRLVKPIVVESSKFTADYFEKLSGRCALSGLYIGKALYIYTNQDIIHQLVDNPLVSSSLLVTDVTLMSMITSMIYKETDYNNMFELCQMVLYRFVMLKWLLAICGYLINM